MAEVRQSFSSNAEELHHRLSPSDPLDTAGSVSACHIGSVETIGHCTSGLGTAEPQVDRDRLISFVKAVHLKYQSSDDEAEAMDNIVIIHMSGNIKTTSSGTINLPKRVSMSGQEISVAGDATSIKKMCSSVTELDLMENNIASWDEVFNIISCIPHLTFLNLTNNPLAAADLGSLTSLRSRPLPSLTHLVLNNTGISWDVLGRLLCIFPRLEELHLGLNKYDSFGLVSTSASEKIRSSVPLQSNNSPEIVPPAREGETTSADNSVSVDQHLQSCSAADTGPAIPSLSVLKGCQPERTADIGENSPSSLPAAASAAASTTPTSMVAATAVPAKATTAVSTTTAESAEVSASAGDSAAAAVTASSSPPLPTCYPTLRRLFFANNCITDWAEISRMGQFFPNMEYFRLWETEITDLGDPDHIPQCFPHLKALGLGRTKLSSWTEVEKLSRFPKLTDVRLSGVPFLEALPKDKRFQHTVALLPNINLLNGSRVMESEREDAERAFIRKYMDADTKPSRYYELEEKYGRLDPLAQVELKPRRTVRLKVRVEDADNQLVKQEEMDIELDQTVRALRKFLSLMADRPAAKIALFYMDNQIEQGLDRLIYLDRKLFSYNMTDGDGIIIAYKD